MLSQNDALSTTIVAIRNGQTLVRTVKVRQTAEAAPKTFVRLWNRNDPSKTITAITNVATPVVTTSTNHGYANGDLVTIEGVAGATPANGTWEIQNVAATTFELKGVAAPGVYTSGGTSYAQPFRTVEVSAGQTDRIMIESMDEHGPFGGKLLSAGLAIAASIGFHRMTAPTVGQEPNVSVDYEAIGA